MSRYRKVSVVIWNDAKFSGMSDDGQLVFLFLLTHPFMTGLGAMRATVHGLAAEKGWTLQRFQKAFGEGLQRGMIKADPTASCVALPKFIAHNKPENPNVVKGFAKAIDLIPECELRHESITALRKACEELGEPFVKAFDEAFAEAWRKSMPIPEPEPEPDPYKEGNLSGKDARRHPPYAEIVAHLNKQAGTSFKHDAGSTRNLIRARWNEGFTLDDFRAVIDAKVKEWGKDEKMVQYLRPQTLFGTKFEAYLQMARNGGVMPRGPSPETSEGKKLAEINTILRLKQAAPADLLDKYAKGYSDPDYPAMFRRLSQEKERIIGKYR